MAAVTRRATAAERFVSVTIRSRLMNAKKIRMKLLVPVFALLVGPYLLVAQSKPPALLSGLGQHHHPISTKNPEA